MAARVGNQMQPIAIDDDEEQGGGIQAMLEEARNRAIIQEAEFTNEPIDLCFAVVKTCIRGDLTAKNRELNRAILQYFQEQVHFKVSHEFFCPRLEPDYSDPQTQPNLQELILYGVDFLTTNAIRDRLKTLDAQAKEVQWINDSACKITCGSPEEVERILKNQVKLIKLEEDAEELKSWFTLKPYTLFSFERALYARYATTLETNLKRDELSRFPMYSEAKQRLASHLLAKFQGFEKYKLVVEEIEAKKLSGRRRRPSGERTYSRSRSNKKFHNQRQQQYSLQQDQQNRRENRFAKPRRHEQQEVTEVKYAHRPFDKNEDLSYHGSRPNRSFHRTNSIITDFNADKEAQKRRPTEIDTSYAETGYKSANRPRAIYDNISELDSNLSFNYGDVALGTNNNEDRMDYHYEPVSHVSNDDDDDFDYQAPILKQNRKADHSSSFTHRNPNPNPKKEDVNQSFQVNQAVLAAQSQSGDFFDFLQSKDHQSSKKIDLNCSFRIEQKPKSKQKSIANFMDDDSY